MQWTYYNHAAVPTTAPHEEVDLTPLKDGSVWKLRGGYVAFARYTTDFDCKEETSFWAVIKDDEYDISKLKAKRRYEITKGRRNFEVRRIEAKKYAEDIWNVADEAFAAYPKAYRPTLHHDNFIKDVMSWQNDNVYGAFQRTDHKMCGYAKLEVHDSYIGFSVQKTIPDSEQDGVNAALVDGILLDLADELADGKYILDGFRPVNHRTNFQDYLEKYFGFRKAYCKLDIVYNPKIRWAIPILWKLRNVIQKYDGRFVHKINAVLRMEAISRE